MTVAYAHIALKPEPQKQGAEQVAMIVNRTLHASDEAVEPFVGGLTVQFLLFKGNERTEA